METFRRTAYGALLQTHQAMGLPVTIPASSTLNEKLSIQETQTLGVNEVPKMRYLCIGIGGHRGAVGTDGIALVEQLQHYATDAAPYRMFPFAARPVDADFSPSERAAYGLRRVENKNGADYAMYYGRRIDMTNVTPRLVKKTILNNVTTTVDFIPSAENLEPVPPPVSNNGSNTVEGVFVCAIAELTITFTAEEVEEMLNAAMVIFASEDYALLSELCLTSGVDRTVNILDGQGASINYNEIIAAQAFTHVSTLIPIKSQRGGFSIVLDVGATEPMFSLANP